MRILEAAHRPEVGAEQPDLELVLAVERQRRAESARPPTVPSGSPSTWRSCDASCRTRNSSPDRRRLRIADRQRADALGRGQIALEQHRRHARARRRCCRSRALESSGGSSDVDVDVERQQIANRVGVLGAIQAMHERPAGIGRRRARRDRACASSEATSALPRGGVRPRHARRRHHARAHLADHLLPHVGVGRRRRPGPARRAPGRRSSAAGCDR